MLKRLVSLVLILPIVLALAYAPLAHAELAQVVVAQVQAGGDGAATQEFIKIFNNSDWEVDISGWCLMNKSNVKFACFQNYYNQAIYLPARSSAVLASQSFVDATRLSVVVTYQPTHTTNGSIIGGNDTVILLDKGGNIVDQVTWTTPVTAGSVYQRALIPSDDPLSPLTYVDTDIASDWRVAQLLSLPDSNVEYRMSTVDVCSNIDGNQFELPWGYEFDNEGSCIEDACTNVNGLQYVVPERYRQGDQRNCYRIYLPLKVSEVLPNPQGSDEGKEFIEVYNPNDQPVDLADYYLAVGVEPGALISLPSVIIQSNGYGVIDNSQVNFRLVNTKGMVWIASPDGSIIETSDPYDTPKDGEAWALIDGEWQYTNQPTPGAANLPSSINDLTANSTSGDASLKPCAANQERNPETNRCRLIASATSTTKLTPCKEGQERNPETNRCRTIAAVSQASLTPCKEGQERNSETNRCRNIVSMPKADYGVLGASTANNDTYWWYIAAAIIGLVVLAASYAIWEWRREISKLFLRLSGFVRSRK